MKRFEVGKKYAWWDCGIEPITVVARTSKTIWVDNGCSNWRMRIKHDEDGNEFVIDSSVPKRCYTSYQCSAEWEVQ